MAQRDSKRHLNELVVSFFLSLPRFLPHTLESKESSEQEPGAFCRFNLHSGAAAVDERLFCCW